MLALTCRHASHTSCLGIANDLPSGFGNASSLPPRAKALVDRFVIPDEPAPWLHHHPSEQRLPSYYGPVRQRAPRLVLNASGVRRRHAPSRDLGDLRSRSSYRRSPSHVPCKSRRSGSRRLYAGHHLAKNTGTRQAHPSGQTKPSVSMPSIPFDASTTTPSPTTDRVLWSAFLIPT